MGKEQEKRGKLARLGGWIKDQFTGPDELVGALMLGAHVTMSRRELDEEMAAIPSADIHFEGELDKGMMTAQAGTEATLQVLKISKVLQKKLMQDPANVGRQAVWVFSDDRRELMQISFFVGDGQYDLIEIGRKRYARFQGIVNAADTLRLIQGNYKPDLLDLNEFNAAFSDAFDQTKNMYCRIDY